MRVLLVINGLDFGGTERAVELIALALRARGHQVCVLSVKRPGRIAERLRGRGVSVLSLQMRDAVGVMGILEGAFKMWRLLRRDRVDIVQSFLPRANILSRIAIRLDGGRVAHVSSERSTDYRRTGLVRHLNRYTSAWTQRVLAVSPRVRDLIVERDGIAPSKLFVLENGLDLAAIDAIVAEPVSQRLPVLRPDRLVFCAVGRFVPEKGFLDLVRAFARARSRDRVQLVLIGEGPQDAELRSEVRRLELEGTVHLEGYRSDVIEIIKGSAAFVLSSVEEGSPMALLEAMACGVPVIATDVSGVRELIGIEAERAALLVPPPHDWSSNALARSPAGCARPASDAWLAEMAQAIDRLACDPALRRELGRVGRRRVEQAFTIERIVSRLEGHYQDVLKGRRVEAIDQPAEQERHV